MFFYYDLKGENKRKQEVEDLKESRKLLRQTSLQVQVRAYDFNPNLLNQPLYCGIKWLLDFFSTKRVISASCC